MIGKMTIDFTKQLLYFATESPKEFASKRTTHTITAIDGNFHRTWNFDITHDVLEIHWENVKATASAEFIRFARSKLFGFNTFIQSLNLISINRSTTQNHFEAVVVWRIMAAGNHDAGLGLFTIKDLIRTEVDHWGSNHTQINYVNAGGQ